MTYVLHMGGLLQFRRTAVKWAKFGATLAQSVRVTHTERGEGGEQRIIIIIAVFSMDSLAAGDQGGAVLASSFPKE